MDFKNKRSIMDRPAKMMRFALLMASCVHHHEISVHAFLSSQHHQVYCILCSSFMKSSCILFILNFPTKIDHRTLPRPGGSNAHGRPDYWESTWGRLLRDNLEELRDPSSPLSKLFRLRFRVPFPLFERLDDWHGECIDLKQPGY